MLTKLVGEIHALQVFQEQVPIEVYKEQGGIDTETATNGK